jgi:uncharacterized protein (TIGR02266 family)
MTPKTSVEQRVQTRVPLRIKVEYERLDDFLDDYAANLSLGGMFVASDEPLPVGSRIRLRFRLPGREDPVETFGEVRWVVAPGDPTGLASGMGVQFEALSPSDRRDVEGWLERSTREG